MFTSLLLLAAGVCVTTQIEELQIYESDSISSSVETVQAVPVRPKSRVSPLNIDTSGSGTLDITVYPHDAKVYVNGIFLGKGSRTLQAIQSGLYSVDGTNGSSRQQHYVIVEPNKFTAVELNADRKLRFVVEPSFNQFLWDHTYSAGPALDLGFQYDKFYYGIDYCWNLFSEDNMLLGGSAFKWLYTFSHNDIVSISPGAMVGFWYANAYTATSYSYGYSGYSDYNEGFFFGGLTAKFCVGYKRIFFKLEHAVLIGNSFANMLRLGLSIRI